MAGYSAIFVILLITFLLTNILVLFSQTLEVLSDVFVSVFLLMSIYWSRRPADKVHMFGHGRAQYVAALVASTILILFMAVEVFREAIPRLFVTPESGPPGSTNLALIVIGISMVVLAIPIADIMRSKARGPSVKAQLVQLLKDEASYVPALIGVVLVAEGYPIADPITSLIIGAVIVLGGIYLFRENVHFLIGKAPGEEFFEKVKTSVFSVHGVLGMHKLMAEYVGPNEIHAGMHIEVAPGTPVEEADRIAEEVGREVRKETGCAQCVIHVDPKQV